MAMQSAVRMHHLSGDWTIAGVVGKLGLLTHLLQQQASAGEKFIHIDCGEIDSIDMSGVQLIHVWRECGRMRDVNIQLVNVPERLRYSMQSLVAYDGQ